MAKHAKTRKRSTPGISTPVAALLAWCLPGLGHWIIGERHRAVAFFVVICTTFWAGIAIGGVRTVVTPRDNGAWIAAQICMGPQGLSALWMSHQELERTKGAALKSLWPASSIGIVYAGVAGLLNLLVIIDVLARVESLQSATNGRAAVRNQRGG